MIGGQLKTLGVVSEMLTRIQNGEPFSSACVRRVDELEERDSDQEVFQRRMGIRNYFKELKMNLKRTN